MIAQPTMTPAQVVVSNVRAIMDQGADIARSSIELYKARFTGFPPFYFGTRYSSDSGSP